MRLTTLLTEAGVDVKYDRSVFAVTGMYDDFVAAENRIAIDYIIFFMMQEMVLTSRVRMNIETLTKLRVTGAAKVGKKVRLTLSNGMAADVSLQEFKNIDLL